jgi:hypothetical protein
MEQCISDLRHLLVSTAGPSKALLVAVSKTIPAMYALLMAAKASKSYLYQHVLAIFTTYFKVAPSHSACTSLVNLLTMKPRTSGLLYVPAALGGIRLQICDEQARNATFMDVLQTETTTSDDADSSNPPLAGNVAWLLEFVESLKNTALSCDIFEGLLQSVLHFSESSPGLFSWCFFGPRQIHHQKLIVCLIAVSANQDDLTSTLQILIQLSDKLAVDIIADLPRVIARLHTLS